MKEYKLIRCDVSNTNVTRNSENALIELGKEGWQIISVNSAHPNNQILIYTLERYVK